MKPLTKGTRVRMTEDALRMGVEGPLKRATGVVVTDQKGLRGSLRILRDGSIWVETYHYSFWEIDKTTK